MKNNEQHPVYTIDLNFMGVQGAIAAYLIPHADGALLVECGPGSTIPALEKGLQQHGYEVSDISHLLLSHIHLDHAGAAGWLARSGVNVYVHPVGAPHMINPDKLLASATRIYGDKMGELWGEFLPVPPENLHTPEDGDVIEINSLRFEVLDTPGHADHHYAYIHKGICFSGDIGGVRLSDTFHLRVPMPPPEFVLEKWGSSLDRLKGIYSRDGFSSIAPTHFGVFDDAAWHLDTLHKALVNINDWMETVMPEDPMIDTISKELTEWTRQHALIDGMPDEKIEAYELASPTWMSSYGIQRYWRKYRST